MIDGGRFEHAAILHVAGAKYGIEAPTRTAIRAWRTGFRGSVGRPAKPSRFTNTAASGDETPGGTNSRAHHGGAIARLLNSR
jgi:hypothetical protein